MEAIWGGFWHILLNILVAINSVVNYPVLSIILFTILMRFVTLPLTLKALRSSRNMQAIQPLMKEIQKKHAKDRAKQQEELMKLYREYNINPAAGCFPMLIQLPVFIGLYSALDFTLKHGGDVEALRSILWLDSWVPFANFNQPFLWLPSLAQPDPLFIWPVLSGVFQFIQSRMAMPLRNPDQPLDPQQKMMHGLMQFMPVYIVFISAGFPAGTVIYWAFSSLFGAVQQYFITGFGSLPDLPGFGWLPRKPFVPPTPPPPRPVAASTPKQRGVMGWMMDKALEAQETQKAAQADGAAGADAQVDDREEEAPPAPAPAPAPAARSKSVSTGRSKASRQHVKTVPPGTMKYASDERRLRAGSGNGAVSGNGLTREVPQLPRKKKNKK